MDLSVPVDLPEEYCDGTISRTSHPFLMCLNSLPDRNQPRDKTVVCALTASGIFRAESHVTDPRCEWMLIAPDKEYKTAQNQFLNGAERVNGLIRLSDVMKLREDEGR